MIAILYAAILSWAFSQAKKLLPNIKIGYAHKPTEATWSDLLKAQYWRAQGGVQDWKAQLKTKDKRLLGRPQT